MTTVSDALKEAGAKLKEAGCDTARLDAELLLAEVTGMERAALISQARRELQAVESERFAQLVDRRRAREPVAYILGRRGFRSLELCVDPRVLIPRPETELLVEVALELPQGARVCDVGTGSGAIALAVKDERPDLQVTATDIDSGALSVARENGERLGIEVEFVQSDLLDGVDSTFDAVLSNPPYVALHDRDSLAPEITEYEPDCALFSDGDALGLFRRLAAGAIGCGAGLLASEVGMGQAEAVAEIFVDAGFTQVELRPDLAGIDRAVVARR